MAFQIQNTTQEQPSACRISLNFQKCAEQFKRILASPIPRAKGLTDYLTLPAYQISRWNREYHVVSFHFAFGIQENKKV